MRRASAEVEISGNADARRRLAEELFAGAVRQAGPRRGSRDEAERVYASLAPGYPGAEARLRYGLLLKRRGNLPAANRVLKELLDGAKLGPAHYRRAQAEWLERARRELS